MHNDSRDNCLGIIKLPCEARHQRQHDNDPELFLLMVGCHNSIEDCVSNLVLDYGASVDGRDEKLVLNIDEVLSILDETQVGVVDGLFSKSRVAADGPASNRSEHLARELFLLRNGRNFTSVGDPYALNIIDFLDVVLHFFDHFIELVDGLPNRPRGFKSTF